MGNREGRNPNPNQLCSCEREAVIDGSAPLYLYGYGSYGLTMEASFSISALSLVERGFIFAIAHIRGGMEMGWDWYENGKLLNKRNTFNDFIDCAEHLVAEGLHFRGDASLPRAAAPAVC